MDILVAAIIHGITCGWAPSYPTQQGKLATTPQLVKEIADISVLGAQVATPAQARELLGL